MAPAPAPAAAAAASTRRDRHLRRKAIEPEWLVGTLEVKDALKRNASLRMNGAFNLLVQSTAEVAAAFANFLASSDLSAQAFRDVFGNELVLPAHKPRFVTRSALMCACYPGANEKALLKVVRATKKRVTDQPADVFLVIRAAEGEDVVCVLCVASTAGCLAFENSGALKWIVPPSTDYGAISLPTVSNLVVTGKLVFAQQPVELSPPAAAPSPEAAQYQAPHTRGVSQLAQAAMADAPAHLESRVQGVCQAGFGHTSPLQQFSHPAVNDVQLQLGQLRW
eukprot:CAMPEP_0119426464 /NCGR_PEP_ID=MMETSP1335-20130426/36405_1 /TAXON_ID=259385 /ORGANISM="Chrysoculter rhomboideus, Strain RCC1486" /LENGTH=279 /DNA_ID=CAMNT_0007452059 /DNA_START=1 /DNA_END=837 /DNA_ORIENTATION=+